MSTILVPGNALRPSSSIARSALMLVGEAWGFRNRLQGFPGAQPIGLEHRHIDMLERAVTADLSRDPDQRAASGPSYVVSEKVDGVRYLLVIGKAGDRKENYSVLVDRKLVCYPVSIAAQEDVFLGSVFDGELVTEAKQGYRKPRQIYLIFDTVRIRGRDIKSELYTERMRITHTTFDLDLQELDYTPREWLDRSTKLVQEGHIISIGNAHNLSFRSKTCLPVDLLDVLCRKMTHLPYLTDGLIFTPVLTPVGTGRQEDLIKWKSEHSIDLLFVLADLEKNNNAFDYTLKVYGMVSGMSVPIESLSLTAANGCPLQIRVVSNEAMDSLVKHLWQKNVTRHQFIAECSTSLVTPVAEGDVFVTEWDEWDMASAGADESISGGPGTGDGRSDDTSGLQDMMAIDGGDFPPLSEALSTEAHKGSKASLATISPEEVVSGDCRPLDDDYQNWLDVSLCRVRSDKKQPNDVVTIQRCIYSTMDNITTDMLMHALCPRYRQRFEGDGTRAHDAEFDCSSEYPNGGWEV